MNIALDYDGTYTLDPEFWEKFLENARLLNHVVFCVTSRSPDFPISNISCPVIYTSCRSKAAHMREIGQNIDIWIDDNPHFIMRDIS